MRYIINILSFLIFWTALQAADLPKSDVQPSSSNTLELPIKRKKKSRPAIEEVQSNPNDAVIIPLSELLRSIPKPTLKATLLDDELDPSELSACCCFSKTDCVRYYKKTNVCSRVSWTITQGISSTIASLSHYARRSLIPLVAFGNFQQKPRNYLLTWIAILQTVGETTEIIHDYALSKAIQTQKNLKKLEDLRKAEKQRIKLKTIEKCAQHTLPKLRIAKNVPLTYTDYQTLSKLYSPESHQLTTLNSQLEHSTDFTWIENLYYSISKFFWTNTYPFFWFAEVALALTQLIIIITDLTTQDEPSLKMSIIMMVIEGLQYLSTNMKQSSEEYIYETYKFRKNIKAVADGTNEKDSPI